MKTLFWSDSMKKNGRLGHRKIHKLFWLSMQVYDVSDTRPYL